MRSKTKNEEKWGGVGTLAVVCQLYEKIFNWFFIRFDYGCTIDNLVLCQIESAGSYTFLNSPKTVSQLSIIYL